MRNPPEVPEGLAHALRTLRKFVEDEYSAGEHQKHLIGLIDCVLEQADQNSLHELANWLETEYARAQAVRAAPSPVAMHGRCGATAQAV
jgi:hypothetical protein